MFSWIKSLWNKLFIVGINETSNKVNVCTICRQPNLNCFHRGMDMNCKKNATAEECVILLMKQKNIELPNTTYTKKYTPTLSERRDASLYKPLLEKRDHANIPTNMNKSKRSQTSNHVDLDDNSQFAEGVAVGLALDAFSSSRDTDGVSTGGGSFGGGGSSGSWDSGSTSTSSSYDGGSSDSSSCDSGSSGGCD